MATVSKGKTWADNEKVNYNDLNDNFDTIYSEFNGGIDNDNIDESANIAVSKINGAVTTSTTQTISGTKTFSIYQTFSKATKTAIATATDGATVTFDLNEANTHQVTLGGNRTLALSNATTGQWFVVELLQDATGSRTVTWFSTIKWTQGTTPTLTTTASKKDTFLFRCTGSGTYDGYIVGQNI